MNYIFFGTPRFAEIVLEELIHAGLTPVALVCNPDRPVGRKKVVTPPRTKTLALRHGGVAILQPEQLDENFIKALRALGADLSVVAAYAKIIPKTVLEVPRFGTLGIHPSLLPKYRGASPIQSAILHGEKKIGVTIYLVDEKMDHGPILAQAPCEARGGMIGYLTLEEKLAEASAELLIKTMPDFAAGKLTPKSQDESQATYTKKFTTEDGFVDEKDLAAAKRGDTEKAQTIILKINALTPEPGVWTRKDGKRIKLLGAEIKNGELRLQKIQKEGGKPKSL